jgi:bifunctional enzyme CysN/CysC
MPHIDAQTAKKHNLSTEVHSVSIAERHAQNGHAGGVMWFTGLSGSGKSTLSMGLQRALFDLGWNVFVLDGDNVRQGLNKDLGFSAADRSENIRRIAEVAHLFAQSGTVVLTAFISPLQADRDQARAIIGDAFQEIHVDTPLSICEQRDVKGLYKKARAGDIPNFTGISAPYEAPEAPELRVQTADKSLPDAVAELVAFARRTFAQK